MTPADFMPWHEAAAEPATEATPQPINPEAQSRLLMAALFKKVD